MASYRTSLGFSLPLLAVALAFLACDETTSQPDGPEDKDGVNVIPSPNGSNGASMGVGGLGQGGEGAGQPCETVEDCEVENPCVIAVCTADKVCGNLDAANDNNACTDDACNADTGVITHTNVPVDDTNVCTFDLCDPVTGVAHLPGRVLFEEDFSDNGASWQLGPQWVIGSAAPSSGGLSGGNDPAMDHTMTNDDGVATTAQGALVTATAAPSTMTSPAITIAGVPATEFVTLSFWRWLNADASPEMTATIEAFNGTAFVPVWTNSVQVIDAPPLGTGWVEVRVDVTAEAIACQTAGSPFRFRFGFSKGSAAPSIGGWNVDDLTLFQTPIAADDNLCTTDTCADDAGTATASYPAITDIDDGDDCTTFACVDNSGPQQQPNGGPGCP